MEIYSQRSSFSFKKKANHKDHTDGSVTKDQSGWGLIVKQGATTIHEDSASILIMEVEAVTHAFRWIASRGDSQTTHAITLTDSMSLLQKVKSGIGSPDWNVPKTLGDVLPWTCRSEGKRLSR